MNKKIIGAILALVVVVFAATVLVMQNKSTPDAAMQASGNDTHQNKSFGGNSESDQSTDKVQSGEVSMDIEGFAFTQKTLKITKGTTVTWTNKDEAKHDISPDQESENFKPSKLLAQGESYSYTFNEPGTYDYHCTPHPYMKASVEVVE